jgi:uncharacterized glyoxalase superfamily protein PhnB
MTLKINAVTFDCENAPELARFWGAALGRPVDPGQAEHGIFFASIGFTQPLPDQPVMMFIKVPEGKTAKNRMHLDLDADDRAAEVERLVAIGATVVHDRDEYGTRWTTLTDPEGNEFCVASH